MNVRQLGMGVLAFIIGMVAVRWADRLFPALTKAPAFLPTLIGGRG